MDDGWSIFYSSWMDKAEENQQAAKVMDDAKNYDQAIVLYQNAIRSYQRAIRFTQFDQDHKDINKLCQEITNRIKQILLQNKELEAKYKLNESDESDTDYDDDDDDDDEEEKKEENNKSISIQIISDIHLEFDGVYNKMPKLNNKDNKASILALLGDIGYPKMDIYKEFIDEISKKYKYILIITGNHEYYKDEIYNVHSILNEIDNKYENVFFLYKRSIEFPDLSSNIRFLGTTLWVNYPKKIEYEAQLSINDFHYIEIDEMALKRDMEQSEDNDKNNDESKLETENIEDVQNKKEEIEVEDEQKVETKDINTLQNDAENFVLDELMGVSHEMDNVSITNIKNKINKTKKNEYEWGQSWKKDMVIKRRLSVDDVNLLYNDQLKWIKNEIIKAKKDKKQLIILTHHSPTSYKCISPTEEIEDVLFLMNFTSLEKLFKYPVISWCFGHTHKNSDFMVISEKSKKHKNKNKWLTRIVSNQLGYYDDQNLSFEAKDYSIDKIITFPNIIINEKNNINDKSIEYIDKHKLKEKLQSDKERISKLSQNLVNSTFTVPL